MAQSVVIHWNLASFTGWGMFGLNLALHWADDPRIEAVVSFPVNREHLVMDPLRLRALEPFLARSLAFQADLKAFGFQADLKGDNMGRRHLQSPILVAASSKAFDLKLEGTPTIGVMFCEDEIARDVLDCLKRLPMIVAGSTWTEQLLRAYGL